MEYESLENVLYFFMSGIVRICELHFTDKRKFPATWLSDYGTKCIPAGIAEFLLLDPREK